jgi:carboxymethylenebutenolidase
MILTKSAVFVLALLFTVTMISPGTTPPSDETAREALENSPRHGEYVDISLPGSERTITTWVVYPERSERAPLVIVIHEIYGLTDWIKAVADQLAADGFIALAPDFVAGMGPGGGNTDAFESRNDLVAAIRSITPDDAAGILDAVGQYARTIPAGTGKVATVGYCWGGAMSFFYASAQEDLDAAVVFYGTSPDTERLSSITAPVLGLYGEDDARVNVTIEPAANEMERLGISFSYEIYEGAGHGFLRNQSGREGANRRASEKAWARTIEFLRETLETN